MAERANRFVVLRRRAGRSPASAMSGIADLAIEALPSRNHRAGLSLRPVC